MTSIRPGSSAPGMVDSNVSAPKPRKKGGKSWLRSLGRGIGGTVDVATAGLTDFGNWDDSWTNYSPLAGLVTDQHNAVASGVKEGATSAWDVLSGERDYRRNRRAFLENRDYTADREDTSYIRLMEQLKDAGINPMLAGQLSPPGVNSSSPPQSNTAAGTRDVLGLASKIFTSGIGGITGLATAQASRASSALSLAQASSTLSKLPGDIAHTAAQTVAADAAAQASMASAGLSRAHSAESQARVPLHRAHVSESQVRAEKGKAETSNIRLQKPKFAAEADFYRRYGIHGVSADKNRSVSSVLNNPQASFDAVGNMVGNSARALNATFDSAVGKLKRKLGYPKGR